MKAPYVVRLLAGTLLGRLPNGMAPLAILLLVQHDGGTLAHAGALCALYALAAALGQPALGRLVDRHGQSLVTGSATALTMTALLALPSAPGAGQLAAGAPPAGPAAGRAVTDPQARRPRRGDQGRRDHLLVHGPPGARDLLGTRPGAADVSSSPVTRRSARTAAT